MYTFGLNKDAAILNTIAVLFHRTVENILVLNAFSFHCRQL